jgi:hypothetical protein
VTIAKVVMPATQISNNLLEKAGRALPGLIFTRISLNNKINVRNDPHINLKVELRGPGFTRHQDETSEVPTMH